MAARAFIVWFLGLAALAAGALTAAIQLIDPYGVSSVRLPIKRALMEQNQRFMYPQVAKSQAFDSLVLGTSSIRLIDPKILNDGLGNSFAMLAINAGSVREQLRILDVFRQNGREPKAALWGIDGIWCGEDLEPPKPSGPRAFPEWLWGPPTPRALIESFSLRALEIAMRMIAFHFGLQPERMRADGYEIFTPNESRYDLERARFHLWRDRPRVLPAPVEPPARLTAREAAAFKTPALALLGEALGKMQRTEIVLALMPIHAGSLAAPGTREAAVLELCKERVARVAKLHGAVMIDFQLRSDFNSRDENFWDPLHYRLAQSGDLARAIVRAARERRDDINGLYKIR